MKMCRDSQNAGASCIIGLGNYEQGQVLLWDQDDGTQSLDELSQFHPELLDVKTRLLYSTVGVRTRLKNLRGHDSLSPFML